MNMLLHSITYKIVDMNQIAAVLNQRVGINVLPTRLYDAKSGARPTFDVGMA